MVFTINNYKKLVGIFLAGLFVHFTFSSFAEETFTSNFIADDCLIRTAIEPDQTSATFRAVSTSQSDFEDLMDWSNVVAGTKTDGNVAAAYIEPMQQTDYMEVKGFYARVPKGSTIHGVQLKITGASTDRALIKESEIHFYLDGEKISSNLAGKSNFINPWKNEIYDWKYGYEFSSWGVEWTQEMLESPELSVRIQLENSSEDEVVETHVDNIELIVHYTPLYELCSHACVVVYNDDVAGATEYIWDVPEGVKFLNNDPGHSVVNLDFSNAAVGLLDIGLQIVVGSDTLSCTRQMLHHSCTSADVGDYVWFDEDYDGQQGDEENGLANIQLELFNHLGESQSTVTTDSDGGYSFQDLTAGYYYIQMNDGGFVSSPQYNGDDLTDSDLSENLQSPIFYLNGGDSIVSMDFGLFDQSSIEGSVWQECDGDGDFNGEDMIMEGIEIQLYQGNNLVNTTTTDENGIYKFEQLIAGDFTLKLLNTGAVSEANSSSNADTQNDFAVDGSYEISLGVGEDAVGIDAALNPKSTLVAFLYFDENENNLAEPEENTFDWQKVYLLAENEIVDSAYVDNFTVRWENLANMNYSLKFPENEEYAYYSNNSYSQENEDGFEFIFDFTLDCTISNLVTIRAKKNGASIGDYVWLDNFNGIQEVDEKGIADIKLSLYNSSNMQVAQTETDENGAYLFENVEEGQYYIEVEYEGDLVLTKYNVDPVLGSKASYVGDIIRMGPFMVENGTVMDTWDIGFKEEFATISDFTWVDSNRNGLQDNVELGLPDVDVKIYTDELFLIRQTKSDENGFYSAEIPAGKYIVVFEHAEYKDYTKYNDTDIEINSDVINEDGSTAVIDLAPGDIRTDIDAGFSPRTGTIGDLVFLDLNANGLYDSDEIGIKDVLIEAYFADGTLGGLTFSDPDGKYTLELEEGEYYLKFSKLNFLESSPHVITDPSKNSDITGAYGDLTTDLISLEIYDEITEVDAGFLTVNTVIGDYVWQDYNENGQQEESEIGMANIQVNLIRIGEGIVGTAFTGNGVNADRGYYSFETDIPGEYYLQFVLPDASFSFTEADLLDDDLDSDVSFDNGSGTTKTFTLHIGENIFNLDAGLVGTNAIIGDFVWRDENNNGLQDQGENGINGMNVFLYDEAFNFIGVTITTYHQESGQDGYYEFEGIDEGDYILVFDTAEEFSDPHVGSNPDIDSDVTSSFVQGSTGIIAMDPDTKMFNVDAGLKKMDPDLKGSIGDMVWEDTNKNGIFEDGEKGMAGIYLELIDGDNNVIGGVESDQDGFYEFLDVAPGSYRIFCEVEDDYEFTIVNNSIDDENDSDVLPNGYTEYFILGGDQAIANIDFGMYSSTGLIAGKTWVDSDKNSMYDPDESTMADVNVSLFNKNGQFIAESSTDNQGEYKFDELELGAYYLKFDATSPYKVTSSSSNNADNSVTNEYSQGSTDLIVLDAGNMKVELNAALAINVLEVEYSLDIVGTHHYDYNSIVWESVMAEHTEYFVVQRRTNDSDWYDVAYIQSRNTNHYTYEDYGIEDLPNMTAYRVKQFGIDDIEVVSEEIWIRKSNMTYFDVYPNPAYGNLNISFEAEKSAQVQLSIFRLDGSLVTQVPTYESEYTGIHQVEIMIESLVSGSYLLKYTSDKDTRTKRIIVR